INIIPTDKGLERVYRLCAILLTLSERTTEFIAMLREAINHLSVNHSLELIKDILFLCAATRKIELLESFLSEKDIIAIGSPQAVLGKVLILQIQKKWELAAETAYHG